MTPPATKPRHVKARQRLRVLIDDIRDTSQTWTAREAADRIESVLDHIDRSAWIEHHEPWRTLEAAR